MAFSVEAWHASKEYLASPPQEVVHYVAQVFDEAALLPEILHSQEIKNRILEEIKPERYAHLALVMDELLKRSLDLRPRRPPYGLVTVGNIDWFEEEPWTMLSYLQIATLKADLRTVQHSTAFHEASIDTNCVAQLDPQRHIRLDTQLIAGAATASSTMLLILRDLPDIIRHHSPETPRENWSAIARHSLSLPTKLARQSINHMLAIKAAVLVEDEAGMKHHDPSKFIPVRADGQLIAFAFDNLEALPLEPNTVLHPNLLPGPYMTVGEVPNESVPTIGCPITLLNGRLGQLWNWTIDIVEQSRLWEAA